MTQSTYNKGDVISGAVLAALGVYIITEARNWSFTSSEGPGPAFFPIWYGVAMVVLSLLLVAGSVLRPSVNKGTAPTNWQGIGRALTVWAAFAASVALLNVIGFLMSFALLTLFIMVVMYGRPLKQSVIAAVGNAVGFYLVFVLALGLSLPVGPLGF